MPWSRLCNKRENSNNEDKFLPVRPQKKKRSEKILIIICRHSFSYRASSALSAHKLMTRPSLQTIWRRASRFFPSGGFRSTEVETKETFEMSPRYSCTWPKHLTSSTLTSSGFADVNAVHPHVDVILHVAPLLIVVEHKTSISPQVEPVLLPPAENGACERNGSQLLSSQNTLTVIRCWLGFGFQIATHSDDEASRSSPWPWQRRCLQVRH